jgi:hypothetical protein
MVAGTEPSTEFSSGTRAAVQSPARTAASAAPMLGWGRSTPSSVVPSERTSLTSAASAKVPSGPR